MDSASVAASTTCPMRTAGDLQLESVLALLLTRPRRGKGFPRTNILDFGCGNGSLLEALRTFPPHMLRRISYVGYDADQKEVAAAQLVATQSSKMTPKIKPLADVLAGCRIGTPDEFRKNRVARQSFHLVNVVNVLHHLHPLHQLPQLCATLHDLTVVGGYLVFHDIFLGNYPEELESSRYGCKDAIYYGPAELSTILSMVSGEPATYRFFERTHRKSGKNWFGFTFVLKKYNTDVWAEARHFYAGTYYAVHQMRRRAEEAIRNPGDWYSRYSTRLTTMVSEMDNAFDDDLFDPKDTLQRNESYLKMLYFQNDPFDPVVRVQ